MLQAGARKQLYGLVALLVFAACEAFASNYFFLEGAPSRHFTDADMQIFTAAGS